MFQDEFTDSASGWPEESGDKYKIGYHPPDVYHVEVSVPNDRRTVFVPGRSFGDFTVETEVEVDHTSDDTPSDFHYGLAIRGLGDRYYAFTISPRTKTWQVLKSSPTGVQVLAEGSDDSIQGLQAKDRLRVDARDATFTFHINGQAITPVNDPDYGEGSVGFFVQTFDESLAHIHYDSLTIREVEVAAVVRTTAPALAPGVLFQDEFTDSTSGWREESTDTYKIGYHPPDVYHIEVKKPDSRKNAFRGKSFDDFTVETEVFVDHTSDDTPSGEFRYGLVIRRSGERYYAFTISPRSKTWAVLKRSQTGVQVLAQGTDDSIQGMTASDRLRIDASGANFTFHINDRVVGQVSDSEYANGDVGFTVETLDERLAHIHYDSLTIRKVEPSEVAVAPAATPVPPTPTLAPSPTLTPIPVPPRMVLIPAGYFQMGSSGGRADEAPEHPVLLDAFYIDRFEVSNAEYRACVNAGACTPGLRDGFTRARYRDDPTFDNYPVVGVTWSQATAYCHWAGKRLPREAEWEYAASGPENRVWPWGNTFDASLSAASAPDTQPVDSYPDGVSLFGVYNMAGNVTEWVEDVYGTGYYANSPASNPVNGGSGAHIHRGGSFANVNGENYTTSRRYRGADTDVDIGFRCAQDAPEENAAMSPEARDPLVADFCQAYSAYKPGAACP